MIDNLKGLFGLIFVLTSIIAPSVVAYRVGLHNGRYQMAKHIPEIRRIERLNALAPRINKSIVEE